MKSWRSCTFHSHCLLSCISPRRPLYPVRKDAPPPITARMSMSSYIHTWSSTSVSPEQGTQQHLRSATSAATNTKSHGRGRGRQGRAAPQDHAHGGRSHPAPPASYSQVARTPAYCDPSAETNGHETGSSTDSDTDSDADATRSWPCLFKGCPERFAGPTRRYRHMDTHYAARYFCLRCGQVISTQYKDIVRHRRRSKPCHARLTRDDEGKHRLRACPWWLNYVQDLEEPSLDDPIRVRFTNEGGLRKTEDRAKFCLRE
jgi:hypothetical protein